MEDNKYIPYPKIRKGIFRIPTDKYNMCLKCWIFKEVELTIIGETEITYLEKDWEVKFKEFLKMKMYKGPIGTHKKFWVRWTATQLSLF